MAANSEGVKKIQIADDNQLFRGLLRRILEDGGFSVSEAENGTEALVQVRRELPSLILLDFNMPGLNGLEVCQRLKQDIMTAGVPILIFTADDQAGREIACLDMGADDYLVKPVTGETILARCRALLRRSQPQALPNNALLTIGPLSLAFDRKLVILGGKQFRHLTPKEFEVLYYLATMSPRACDRETIYRQIWGMGPPSEGSLKTVEVHIRRIRLKMDWPGNKWLVRIPGRGYCIEQPLQAAR